MLGHSSDELRATGGFVSAAWLVSFVDGALDSIIYFDIVLIDDWDNIADYPKAPTTLEEHMNAWVWLMRDVSWDPNFPSTAKNAEVLFQLGQGIDVDGVLRDFIGNLTNLIKESHPEHTDKIGVPEFWNLLCHLFHL